MKLTECIDCSELVITIDATLINLIDIGYGYICDRCSKDHEGETDEEMSARIIDHKEGLRIFRQGKKVKDLIENPEDIETMSDAVRHRKEIVDFIVYGNITKVQRTKLFSYLKTMEPKTKEARIQ